MKKMKVRVVQIVIVYIIYVFMRVNSDATCETEPYYDSQDKTFKCLQCGDLQVWDSTEHRCECVKTARMVARVDEYNVTCLPCEQNQIATADGWDCTETDSCKIEPHTIQIDRDFNGTVLRRECAKCENGTQPNADKQRCYPCPMYLGRHFCQQDCTGNFQQTTGGCVPRDTYDRLQYKMKYLSGEEVESHYLRENYAAAVYKCSNKDLLSRKACNVLLNICVLKHYDTCEKTTDSRILSQIPPFDPVERSDEKALSTEYSFKQYKGKNSKLRIRVARFTAEGQFLGLHDAGVHLLKICGGQNQMDETPFLFGVWCAETCYTLARTIWKSWETEFYELFIIDGEKTYRIPVVNQNINKDKKKLKYTYRFFLVDNISGRSAQGKDATVVQYASSIKLSIRQAPDGEGFIFIPVLTLQYKDIKMDVHNNDSSFVTCESSIDYSMEYDDNEEQISIAVGVLSVFAILYSGIETWSWSKRSGRIAIDFHTLLKLVLYVSGSLANTFLLVVYSATLLRLVYYKEQDKAEMMLPTQEQEGPFFIYVITAFCLKTVDIFHMIMTQVNVDVFFIDWERPMLLSGASGTPHPQPHPSLPPISIWRTYFIANEWNKMQTTRKTCASLNFVALLLLLKVFSLEDIALLRPSHGEQLSHLCSPFSMSSRFAIAVSFFFAVAVVQMVFRKFLVERYYVDKLIQFTDVCSVSNISVFVLEHAQFGYYIHGQSVYGNSDIDMKGFSEQLKREQDNLCSQRGLLPNTTLQTFKVFITKDFQRQCHKIMQPFTRAPESHSRLHFTVSLPSFPNGPGVTLTDQLILSYKTMNKFLSTFIDHALQDLDYVIKDMLPSERFLDVEFLEPMDKTFFYNDPLHSFSRVLFYGQEFRLLIWEILLICLVDLIAQDFVLAVVIAFVSTKAVQFVRHYLGERNIVRKSLVDGRFIMR